jgi:DNA ligase-1
MDYSSLVAVYRTLEKTPARLGKVDAIAGLLREADPGMLPKVTLLLQGMVFPAYSSREIGIADRTVIRIIASATDYKESDVVRDYKKTGDLGLTVETVMRKRSQSTLSRKRLDVDRIFGSLRELASVQGSGSQDRKMRIVAELIMHSSPEEAKYIVRTILGQLRVGVAEGVVRDAIAKAFFPGAEGAESKDVVNAIEWAWFLRPDYGEVARIAREDGMEGLRGVRLSPGRPYLVCLAERTGSLQEALESFQKPALEYKYDGARIVIHKKGGRVWLYTRRLEDVTEQFPEVAERARESIRAEECILEGEMLATDPRSGKPMPFQSLSQRIKRKYGIRDMAGRIPVEVNLFDMVYSAGDDLFGLPLAERRRMLEAAVKPSPGFRLAKQLVTRDLEEAEAFYKEALEHGQEGVMVKNLEAAYQPGRRVGYWLKVKPTMENLDLVIIGATWGTGKRTGWMGSFLLGVRDEAGGFLECGMIGTGIKEKEPGEGSGPGEEAEDGGREEGVTFARLTGLLRPHIRREEGNHVDIGPSVVVEVAYEEIQKSPTYSSGYALRFPRVVRIRADRRPEDADTAERIGKLYSMQRGRTAPGNRESGKV